MSLISRRELLKAGLRAAPLAVLPGALSQGRVQKKRRGPEFNVLFIAVDDLRPDLGCYGHPIVQSPNIDRLSSTGLTFTRNYCQQAVCNPSRVSLLTGRRPDATRVYDSQTHFRRYLPDVTTLPQQFKRNGYVTTAFGKIYDKPAMNDLPSWSIAPWVADLHDWRSPENEAFAQQKWRELQENDWVSSEDFCFDPIRRLGSQSAPGRALPSWDNPDVSDDTLPDGRAAEAAVAALRELRGQRFFLAAGFLKPHLPFVAPKKYYDLYPLEKISLAANPEPPADIPEFALHDSSELRGYKDIPSRGPIPESKARELIRGYYAAVSYVDAQIGRLLGALDELGLRENTVVVLWGDHGYHLGEHGLWNEQTNFEAATRSPLIVSYPGQRGAGRKTPALTEFVDVYPSLCEICELPRPLGLEGSSFVALFEDPDRLWKRAVFSQHPREIAGIGPVMGYSMRTVRYRYTEWTAGESPFHTAELYDYESDPWEQRNIANRPENISLVNGLAGMLREGWRASLPPTEIRSTE